MAAQFTKPLLRNLHFVNRCVREALPPSLDSTSASPALFDGTTRLDISYTCPYAQRAWIAPNYKGLQDKIKLVAINLNNRPAWYKEKVYPRNKGPAKQQFAEELLAYSDEFNSIMFTALPSRGGVGHEAAAFDNIEDALSKFDDGPFFLGQFSMVDIACIPFFEGFQTAFLDVKNYDITKGRPKLSQWIEEMNKIDAYSQTLLDPQLLLSNIKRHLGTA